MKKRVLVVLIIIVLVVLGIIYSREKSVAPTVETKNSTQPVEQKQSSAQPQQSQQQSDNSSNDKQTMGLEIKTTKEGTGDRIVKAGDTVSVLYTGKLTDGTVFDASSKHGNQPFEFKVGLGMVIKGWDQGLLGAKVGEQRTLTIPGDLAYGPQGIPGVIPPNATLVFDVEVVAIK
ncbi:MAG TPA: FKBP-type peptidyl-prolyl cis-trans isomerase [Patescibacteria group bacterium]